MRWLLALLFLAASSRGYAQTYAILADRLIDGKSDQPLSNPTIIVKQGKIVDVNFNRVIPDSAIVIDLKGQTILPGLMDVHTHLLAGPEDYDKDLYGNSPSYRALRDVCSEGAGFADVDLARAVDSGFVDGPRVFPAGPGIAATGQYLPFANVQNWTIDLPAGTQYATGVDECIKVVREQRSRGVKWIKVYADFLTPTFSAEEMKAIVSEANKLGIQVAAHAQGVTGIRLAIEAGVRSIEIQKGYIADIIAVRGNPLEDIALIRQVDFVMKEGKVYKRP